VLPNIGGGSLVDGQDADADVIDPQRSVRVVGGCHQWAVDEPSNRRG